MCNNSLAYNSTAHTSYSRRFLDVVVVDVNDVEVADEKKRKRRFRRVGNHLHVSLCSHV
jgi:hypothetical protein